MSRPWGWTGTDSNCLHRAIADAAARGAAVVLVTHDLAYARATAHRVLALDGGSLREI